MNQIIFLPGSGEGGLGRHAECLREQYPKVTFWDYSKKIIKGRGSFQKIWSRISGKWDDGSYTKFSSIDVQAKAFYTHLIDPPESILAFSGCCLGLFETARKMGCKILEIESPTAHISHCNETYQYASKGHPLERCWLSRKLRDKILAEYQIADIIWVNSEYSKRTFLDRGFPPSKLKRRYLSVHPRFLNNSQLIKKTHNFKIIYVGSLTVTKGVPVLLEAFRSLSLPNIELSLIGGTASRGMFNLLMNARRIDPRISFGPGDPLPHLIESDLFVFPSWSDGFGLAAAEAHAVGIPVIVSENSGVSEIIAKKKGNGVFKVGNSRSLAYEIQKQYLVKGTN